MSASIARRPAAGAAVGLAGIAGLLLAAYAETIRGFLASWSGRDDYSHGFLVPLISAYFIWRKRERLGSIDPHPDLRWGTALLAAGGALLFVGTMGSAFVAQQLSILVVIPGLVLLLFGRAVLREVLLPLAYLAFMVPAVIDPLLGNLHWPLQLLGAAGAARLLELAGVPVLRHQQFLELPNITLEVANQCSGLRYLVSIIALSVPLAHVSLRSSGKRSCLILAAAVIGILANPVRIALIGLWVYGKQSSMVHGPSHVFQGFFVSMAGMAFLFATAWGAALLDRDGTARQAGGAHGSRVSWEGWAQLQRRFPIPWSLAAAILLLLAFAVTAYRPVDVPLAVSRLVLPPAVGGWEGRAVPRAASPLRLAQATAEAEMAYRAPSGTEVQLYVGYLGAQKQGRELIYYTYREVYDASVERRIEVPGRESPTVNLAVLERPHAKLMLVYWYDIGGNWFASRFKAKVFSGIRGVLTRRTNGAVVSVTRPLREGESTESVAREMLGFVREASPALSSLLAVGGGSGAPSVPVP